MRRGVVVVGLLAMLVAALSWPGPGPLIAAGDDWSRAAFWVLVGAAALGLLPSRHARWAALPVVAAGWVLLGVAASAAVGTGLPSPTASILVAGGVMTGAAVGARAFPDRPVPPWWRVVAATAAAVIVVTGLAAGLDALAWRLPVVDDVAAPSAPPTPPVARPGAEAWTWRDPVASDQVLAAGPGVVVARRDGVVVALDGRTGRSRWSAGRRGSDVSISVTPDRRTVVLATTAGAGRSGEGGRRVGRLAVLSSDTGRTRWEQDGSTFVALAESVLVTSSGSGLTARSLYGEWPGWSAPAVGGGCSPVTSGAVAPVVAVLWSCPDHRSVLQAYDQTTGAPLWRVASTDVSPRPMRVSALFTPLDGSVLAWHADLEGDGPPSSVDVLLDPRTGAVLARPDDADIRLTAGSRPVLRSASAIAPSTPVAETALTPTEPVPLPPTSCAAGRLLAVTATADATVRLCNGQDGPVLEVDGVLRTPLPVDRRQLAHGNTDGVAPLPDQPDAFLVPASGAFVAGVRQTRGTTLVGFAR